MEDECFKYHEREEIKENQGCKSNAFENSLNDILHTADCEN